MATTSTNMLLPIPVVGVDDGPQWATYINDCLGIIDGHDHSPGSGVQITPAGLNISSDLSFSSNNATSLRSARFTSQSVALSGASDLGCVYAVGANLYYNDGLGNQIAITANGAVAGTPGSIANLTSPASASWVSGSSAFVFQADSNVAANLDGRNVKLRNATASSNALTLSPPNAMGSDYTIVLPALPGSTKILTMDSSGNMSANYGVDSTTISISSSNLKVTDGGISATQLASDAVTTVKILDSNVTTAKIANANVTSDKLASSIAGNGLTGGAGTALSVVTDGAGIEISANALRLKALGVATGNIANLAVTAGKIASDAVTTAKILNSNVTAAKIESNVNLPGTNVQAGSRNLIVANTNFAGSVDYALLRLQLSSAGDVTQGEGTPATNKRTGTGTYLIDLSTVYSGVCVAVASIVSSNGQISASCDGSAITVNTYSATGVAADKDFSVIIMGPR